MNPRKLTAGFRKVFGASVFGYLQEYRLREAHRMLCDEEANVSTVAYRVGYSPAHFSIAFRKRYGISPARSAESPRRPRPGHGRVSPLRDDAASNETVRLSKHCRPGLPGK